jgi:uncharacterized repeat protein (TIGR03803 family)
MIVSARQERKPLGRFGLVGCATAISLGVIASFGIADAQTSYEVLHDFTGGPTDGENPSAGVIGATDGNLYGTTYWGGGGDVGLICDGIGCGTVFEITAEGAVTIVHAFAGSDTTGAPHPDGGLVQGTDGFLYGTTVFGGGSGCEGIGCGTVFRVATDGSGFVVLHTFMGAPTDGANPSGALIQAMDGFLYGTTESGGGSTCGASGGCGTIFRMATDGSGYAVLHAFMGGSADGTFPSGLIQATNGLLFGTTAKGGSSACNAPEGCGTLFRIAPDGTGYSVLHTFRGDSAADGVGPGTPPIQATDGSLYGTTEFGGSSGCFMNEGCGTIFTLTPDGNGYAILHTFTGGLTDGESPLALLQTTDGNFYGTTNLGGSAGAGVVFRLTIGSPPSITSQPANQTITSGSTTTLSVTASGTGPLSYQWYTGASGTTTSPISGATGSSYTTPALTATTSYWVQVSNGSTVDSNTATVSVLTAPTIMTQPVSQTATPGKNPQFTMGAAGTPPPTFQWQVLTGGVWSNLSSGSPYSGVSAATLTVSSATADMNGTEYRCVVTNSLGSATSSAATLTLVTHIAPGDFDADGKSDLTVYRPSNDAWYILQSSTSFTTYVSYLWGLAGDVAVRGDFDGDGKEDIAVYRPSNGGWYILLSSTGYTTYVSFLWGVAGDTPETADYDGDGKTDIAVYRPSSGGWYILSSSTNYTTYVSYVWGLSGDMPVPGDYDGDGKADIAVYRPFNGGWYILQSSTGYTTYVSYLWGLTGDLPILGDFDGDGKTDLAVYRPSNGGWYILKSSTNGTTYGSYLWGLTGDLPVLGDFDGDGKTEIAVYRPSNGGWYILLSSTNYTTFNEYLWGLPSDIPLLKWP